MCSRLVPQICTTCRGKNPCGSFAQPMEPPVTCLEQISLAICPQVADVQQLAARVRCVLGEFCSFFWARVRPVQLARGLVASPHAFCAMSLGVRMGACSPLILTIPTSSSAQASSEVCLLNARV